MKRRFSLDLQLVQHLRAGPLQPFLDDYARLLVKKGYCHRSGSMGLLDWDGTATKLEIVKDDWVLQMRPDN